MSRTGVKYLRSRIAVFAALWLCLLLTAGAGAAENESGSVSARSVREKLQNPISYSCTEKPIGAVLMDLADQGNIDIIKSPEVTGNVTVKLTDVPLEEALTNILAANNYTYIATENMIRVVPLPQPPVPKEQLVTRIYQITYADANEVAAALGSYVSGEGRVAFTRGTNHIIVTDTQSKIKGIDKFIEQIDTQTPQVLVEVRIYDVSTAEGFELDTDWRVGRNAPLTGDVIPYTDKTVTEVGPSSTTYTETRTDTTTSEEFISGNYRDSDDPPGSMVTRGTTVESRDEFDQTFNSGSTNIETRTIEPPRVENLRRKPFVGGSFDRIEGGTLRFSLLNDAVDIDFVLNILHQQLEAKLLANPRVLVLDNQTANFEVVREIPYREVWQVGRADPITFTEFKNVGVSLNVTPHIARDGMIRLHIQPEFGVLVGQNADGAPTVDTRRADTVAMIKDGQTIVMSGLRQRETTKDISKVPLLADMPLIGGLFKSESESVQVKELVVFITTHIVRQPVLSAREKDILKATEFESPKTTPSRIEKGLSKTKTTGSIEQELKDLVDLLSE